MTREFINIYLDNGAKSFMTSSDAGGEIVELADRINQPEDDQAYVLTTDDEPILVEDIIAHIPEDLVA